MAIRFNPNEILTVAEQIERNGAMFYRRAAGMEDDADAKEMLVAMAAMEDEHEQTFASMRADLTEQERQAVVFDPEGELPLYLRALADRTVFDLTGDPWARLTGKEEIADILRVGIGVEKDAIVFYLGLKEMVPKRFGGDRIDAIIKEEMGHISTLATLARRLGG